MGHKRTRNHYPRLPEAVLNLLALHSLEAWPAKVVTWHRGAKRWQWKVIRAGADHINSHVLFTITGNRDLVYWMSAVQDYVDGKMLMSLDFETHGVQTGRWTMGWLDELRDIEARMAAVAGLPHKP